MSTKKASPRNKGEESSMSKGQALKVNFEIDEEDEVSSSFVSITESKSDSTIKSHKGLAFMQKY